MSTMFEDTVEDDRRLFHKGGQESVMNYDFGKRLAELKAEDEARWKLEEELLNKQNEILKKYERSEESQWIELAQTGVDVEYLKKQSEEQAASERLIEVAPEI